MLKRVLIANRGEIAIRIARAAAGLGMESVAVYALADADALHTRLATEACALPGGGDPVRAYLDIESLISTAQDSGCDCVHPGYGFLSENPQFAARCAEAGLTFVGPSADVLALFGDKVRARELAQSIDIPVVRGSGPLDSVGDALAAAEGLGYPVMLKAAGGGGGRGMRRVLLRDDLADAFTRCRSEAAGAFGNGTLFLERLLDRPRHIEVQVLADAHGRVVHLYERDCSVQLRHQKVLEVAPAPRLPAALRQRLLDDAVRLVRQAGYVNAGTVEFLVSPETGAHCFIECNPRIQVEHTVTEEVTGVDLVAAQFRIASGATLVDLGMAEQSSIAPPRRCAVQARVTVRGSGRLSAYKEPSGPGVRVDGSGYLGYAPPPQFDPLLAKVIGSAGGGALPSSDDPEPAYAAALDRTLRALDEFHIAGVDTNVAELRALISHPAVRAGDARVTLIHDEPERFANPPAARGGAIALLDRAAGSRAPDQALAPTRDQCHEDGNRRPAPCAGTVAALLPLDAGVSVGRARCWPQSPRSRSATQQPNGHGKRPGLTCSKVRPRAPRP
jgi:pyruvate carboxylase